MPEPSEGTVVDFLKAWCVTWTSVTDCVDRLPGHRSRLVQELHCQFAGLDFHCLSSALRPELNPVGIHLGYWKQHDYQCLPKDYWQLSEAARRTLRRMRRRPRLITPSGPIFLWQE